MFGVGRSAGIEKMSLISLTSEERRARPHIRVGIGGFRIAVEPRPEPGLRVRSQVMADRPVMSRRERIARLSRHLARLNWALALAMGLAD
jgi:hypothetical protein